MAEQRTILTFEGGVVGATIDPADVLRKPPKWDESGSSLSILRSRYTADAHAGSRAANVDQTLGGGSILVTATAPYGLGGGGWVKSTTPPGFAGDPIVSGTFNSSSPSLARGIGIYYNAGVLEARYGATVYGTTAYVADRWIHLQLAPSGAWTLTDSTGATLMSGTVTAAAASPYDAFIFFAQAGTTPGSAIVDDVSLWWQADGPVTRLYPRDDGRGMSSGPRIWPPAKGRSRIIGGFQ